MRLLSSCKLYPCPENHTPTFEMDKKFSIFDLKKNWQPCCGVEKIDIHLHRIQRAWRNW